MLPGHADDATGAGLAGQKLFDDDDDFAFGVPFAEIPQRFGYPAQRVAAVDDDSDLPRLAELHQRRQVLHAEPDGQLPYVIARLRRPVRLL